MSFIHFHIFSHIHTSILAINLLYYKFRTGRHWRTNPLLASQRKISALKWKIWSFIVVWGFKCIAFFHTTKLKCQKFLPNLWKQTCVLLSDCAVKYHPQHVPGFLSWPSPYKPGADQVFALQRPALSGASCCSQWLCHRWAPSWGCLRKSWRAVAACHSWVFSYSWPVQAFLCIPCSLQLYVLSSKLFWILGHERDFFCDVYNVTENERIFS